MNNQFSFKIVKKDSKSRARVGVITTPHGEIETPTFTPVGTQATVKSLSPEELKECGAQLIFGNTYHLHLKPGEDVVEKFGGLAKFMNWNKPTITDSGGFQVFSLGKQRFTQIAKLINADTKISENLSLNQRESTPALVKITDDGVKFRSHHDGSLHEFTPEKSIEIQHKLGADIILAFDYCAPYPFTHESTKDAMEKTHKWAERCLEYHKSKVKSQSAKVENGYLKVENSNRKKRMDNGKNQFQISNFYNQFPISSNQFLNKKFNIRASNSACKQALYGIVQGGVYKDLREESARFIGSMDFDGMAIGGVSVGESKKEMREAVDWVVPFLPEDKPRHLLGIGEIDDIFDGVERGMDTFDCVIPNRFGRYGIAFVEPKESEIKGKYRIDLNRVKYVLDKGPIAKNCQCSTCQNYTRGYLHHLFRANELLGYRLVSLHNIYFIMNLTRKIRQSILEDKFQNLKEKWLV